MIWPWTDYIKGSKEISPETALSILLGSFKILPNFSGKQLLALIALDDSFLALEYFKAREFASSANDNWNWSWEKNVRDCEDQEAMFRAGRVKARWRAGFNAPEAFGGICYLSRSRKGWHWASWAIVIKDGVLTVRIYQPDKDQWQEPDEAVEVEYFDA